MRSYTIILCLFSSLVTFSQATRYDSLINELPSRIGRERVLLLQEIVKSSWTTEPSLSLKYGREAIKLSEQLNDLYLLSSSYRVFGGIYNYMSQIDSGRYYKLKALDIAHQLNDSILLASSYNNLGVTSQTIGNYVESLSYYYMAYLIGKRIKDFESLPVIMANVSEVYYDLKAYDSAISYARQAVKITERKPNTSHHLLILNALARSTLAKGDFTEAETLYNDIIRISNDIGDKRYAAFANQGLGRLYTKLNNSQTAQAHLQESLQLFQDLEDETYLAECYRDLSILMSSFDQDSAFFFIRKSLRIAKKLQLKDIMLADYEQLIRLFGDQDNYDSLKYYRKKYKTLESAQRKEINLQSIDGMFAKLKDEQIRIRLANQGLQLKEKTFQTNFSIALAIITLLFSALIFRYYRKQKRLGSYLASVNNQMQSQNELIALKNKELNALNNEKNDIIKIVAHDLKSPLSNIINASQLIHEFNSSGESSDVPLKIIEGSAKRLSGMITQILDVEAIEKGLSNIKLVSVNLTKIVHDICVDYQNVAEKKHLVLNRDVDEQVMVYGEPTYMHQVIENIASNAIKYSPKGKNIYVTLKAFSNMARLEIKDEGPGISDKEQAQLFQMYQKLSATPTGKEHSSGIGLSVAKKYVEAMDGRIWCKSELEHGASFYVAFKLVS